ncbi:MAG: diadenylate cyclase CdaA [Armatimonadota bacterium]
MNVISVIRWFGGVNYIDVFTWLLDISLVTFIMYKLIMSLKGTRAWQIIVGLGVYLLLVKVSDMLHLRALNGLLRIFLPLGPVALVILFFPEMRNLLEQFGRLKFLGQGFVLLGREDINNLIDQLTKSVTEMSRVSVGALIVIEREVGLDNIIANGRHLNAVVSSDLLRTIFYPGSPLHDGAVIIRGNRILAAGCTLPLSDNPKLGTMIHTRHKAALGVTEQSDAMVLVVSEETGTISVSIEGSLERGLTSEQLRARLTELLQVEKSTESRVQIRRVMHDTINKIRTGNGNKPEQKKK